GRCADRRDRLLGRGGGAVRPRPRPLGHGRAARRGRCRGPGLGRAAPDDPAGLRPGRDARSLAGRVRGGGRRRSATGRPAGRGDRRAGPAAGGAGVTFSWVAGGLASIVLVLSAVALAPAFRRYDASVAPEPHVPPELEEPAEPSMPPVTADDEALRDIATSD